jgi:CDP-6-deoxy-D-xylo-4-hexulose-3-dehydrase
MVNSGSSALILAMNVLNIKKGDEVITPCLNFGTAVSSIILLGALPKFVDIDVSTLQINIEKIEKKITSKTKAILVPNLIGNIPNWKKIRYIAEKYNLKVIEDSADTLGAKINNKYTGFFSDISITSFYGSHVISCAGNGGMFLTNNKKMYERAKVLRSWGRMSTLIKDSENIKKRLEIKLEGFEYDKKFVFSEIGYNFEPSELGASFGLVQLKRFNAFSKIRNKNFFLHKKFFSKFKNLFIVPSIEKGVKTNFLAYPIITKKNKLFNRKKLQIFLEKNNIQTRPIFSGNILRHPAFKYLNSAKNKINQFPNSDYIMKNGLLIGCHQGLSRKHIEYIHKVILRIIK